MVMPFCFSKEVLTFQLLRTLQEKLDKSENRGLIVRWYYVEIKVSYFAISLVLCRNKSFLFCYFFVGILDGTSGPLCNHHGL